MPLVGFAELIGQTRTTYAAANAIGFIIRSVQNQEFTAACNPTRFRVPLAISGLIAIAGLFGGCGSTNEPGERVRGLVPIPSDISYTVVDTQVIPDIKRSLDVRLNRKVSEEVLRAVAFALKNSDSRSYQRTFISYYLPGMEIGAGAWASSHFSPDLQIRVFGLSVDQETFLLTKSTSRQGPEVVGKWLDDWALGGLIVIYRESGKVFMETTYPDGSGGKEEAVEKASPFGRRFDVKERSDSGDYCVIDKNGDLQHRDGEGLIRISRKII